MQTKANLSNLIQLIACAGLLCATTALAEDAKPDPTGTWAWTNPGRNGGPDRTNLLTLKLEGDKLSGTLSTPRRGGEMADTPIKDGKVSADEVSFTIAREFNGNTMTSKYSGKLTADSIKGKIEVERDGETRSRDWEAKRQAAKPDKADSADKAEKK